MKTIIDRNYLEKNDGVMLTSQAGSLLGDMMWECHLFSINLKFLSLNELAANIEPAIMYKNK